jgi:ABC-type nitrate/sulfonate/bicarbonate transport system permease component
MPGGVIILLLCLGLGAWFLLGEKSSLWDKLMIIFLIVFVYVFVMICTGVGSIEEIFKPVLKLFN